MKVPSPGESISEVEIAEWIVNDGDYVEKDQSIAEIDSDKATLELPAEESGTIKIIVEEQETVSVGDVVCIIDTSVKRETQTKISNKKKSETSKKLKKNNKNLVKPKTTPLASIMLNAMDISSEEVQEFCEKLENDFKKLAERTIKEIINLPTS